MPASPFCFQAGSGTSIIYSRTFSLLSAAPYPGRNTVTDKMTFVIKRFQLVYGFSAKQTSTPPPGTSSKQISQERYARYFHPKHSSKMSSLLVAGRRWAIESKACPSINRSHRFLSTKLVSCYSKRPTILAHRPDAHLTALTQYNGHQRRYLITEIIQAISSPFETLQQLKDTKKMLEDVKEDFLEQYELSKIPRITTFEPLPGFFPRPRETRAIKLALTTQPSFMVIFGSSSVGKTALLREVLSNVYDPLEPGHKKNPDSEDDVEPKRQKFVVMHIDLRIAGFADLSGLAVRLASQFELFFETIMTTPEEDGIFKTEEDGIEEGINYERINAQYAAQYKEAFKGHMLAFRQLRKQHEARMDKAVAATGSPAGVVTIGDIAAIMERFQSSLLYYWQFEINTEEAKSESERQRKLEAKEKERIGFLRKSKSRNGLLDIQALKEQEELERRLRRARNRLKHPRNSPTMSQKKRIPVILLDEAHRLPALLDSQECVKALLDSFLVLTKQDRLCHVIHTTSDPFYLHWLRALNIAQHTKIITLQDCTYEETHEFYHKNLLPNTIEKLPSPGSIKQRLPEFDAIWDMFGGRLAHISDYMAEFICSDGTISPQQSSHFTQAYANVKIHLTHHSFMTHSSIPNDVASSAEFDSKVFSNLIRDLLKSTKHDTADCALLPKYSLDYFSVCEKYGSDKINAIVTSRLFDVAWTPSTTSHFEATNSDDNKESFHREPASALARITPPQLKAMSRVIEKAMELIFSDQLNDPTTR